MCILNRIQIWPKDAILHFFQGTPRVLPLYLCIRYVQKFVCVNMYYVLHMTRGSQSNKIGETYAKLGVSFYNLVECIVACLDRARC
jgi:hypothetical protein